MLTTHDLVVNGVRSAVYDAGLRQTEAVVFVHGNPGPLDDWEFVAPEVAAFSRSIAVDMPGFGRAAHPRNFDFTIEGYARHLAGLLEQLEVQRAHLVMHDFGGAWGLKWAADHPGALASVTLINTGVLSGYEWHRAAKIWQLPVIGELFQLATSSTSIRWAMNRDNPKPLPPDFIERVAHYADWNQKRAVLKLYRACKDVEASFGRFAGPLRTLNPPACVIWGARDRYLPARFAEKQRETFPRAEVHVLEGLGHWPFIDDPAAVRQHLLPFLRRELSASGVVASA